MSELIPANVYRAFLSAGNDWADKHGAAELLEGSLKSLKALIALEAKNSEGCSMSEADNIAIAASDYQEAFAAAVEAKKEATKARVRYDATKALFEAQRTAEASERAAMRSAP